MGERSWAAVTTPIGTMWVAATGAGLSRIKLPGGRPESSATPLPALLIQATGELTDYFGEWRTTFDLPIDWSTVDEFKAHVLKTLEATVPFGTVISYGDLAARAGDPRAAQTVGEIMATNPYPIVVPCHRVVASDGLGGYGGGLDMKRWLLAHEGVLQPMLDFPA
jgi:methylated-DNA-[protein]-cysteine S-methyltransferase